MHFSTGNFTGCGSEGVNCQLRPSSPLEDSEVRFCLGGREHVFVPDAVTSRHHSIVQATVDRKTCVHEEGVSRACVFSIFILFIFSLGEENDCMVIQPINEWLFDFLGWLIESNVDRFDTIFFFLCFPFFFCVCTSLMMLRDVTTTLSIRHLHSHSHTFPKIHIDTGIAVQSTYCDM